MEADICRGDTPFSWSSETPWRTLSSALKNHTGHNPSQQKDTPTQTHLKSLVQSAGAESEDDGSEDEWGAEERPTRRHLIAAAEAVPEESSDEDVATLRKAKPANKPRDSSKAPEPMSPAPLPKRKKPSPLATQKKASPLATDPRKRSKQLSGAEAAQARAERLSLQGGGKELQGVALPVEPQAHFVRRMERARDRIAARPERRG